MDVIFRILDKFTGFNYWFVAILIVIGLGGWYYLGRTKRAEQKIAKKQILFTGFLVVIGALGILLNHLFFSPEYTFPKDNKGILVLLIEGDDEKNTLQRDLVSTLNSELKQIIEVCGCNKTVTEAMGFAQAHMHARKIGKDFNALIVIWGNLVGDKKFHPRITIVDNQLPSHILTNGRSLKPQNISEFNLPSELVNQPILLGHFLAGYNYYRREDYLAALSCFEAVLNRPATDAIELKYIQFFAGNSYLFLFKGQEKKASHIDKAITNYSKAIKIDPKYDKAFGNRGLAYHRQGNYEEAISDYSKVLEINPKDAKAYYNRGLAYIHQSHYEEAVADFSKIIEIDSKDVKAYYNRGLVYYRQGNYDEAVADFSKTIEINPKDAKAYNNRGLVYLHQGHYEEAVADFSKAIEINPRHANAYNNRGNVYAHQSYYDKAIADYSKIIEIDPKNAMVYGNLAYNYLFKKQFKKTIEAASKGLELDSTQTWIKINLAHGYLFDGQYEKAQEIYLKNKNLLIDEKPWSQVILDDFDQFKKKSIYHSDIEKIKDLIK